MWQLELGKHTNTRTVETEGDISLTIPSNIIVTTFINTVENTTIPIHVKVGDTVKFKIVNLGLIPDTVLISYAGAIDTIVVPVTQSTEIGTINSEGNDMTPAETINLFANPNQGAGMGGALGGGLGAGLVGGLLSSQLFGRNGIGVNGIDGATGMGTVSQVVNDASIMQTLGDIKASIPLAEGQVQLALAGAQADINNNISNHSTGLQSTLNTQALAISSNFANTNSNLAGALSQITSTANQLASTNLAAIKDAAIQAERNAWAITQAITNDGDRTRSLIQSIDKSNDSRTITNLSNEVIELRGDQRLATATGNITISNNNAATANAQQQQSQQQQQLQYQILAQLGLLNADLQSVKQSSVVFNSGLMANAGNQTAANTRVA